MKMRDAKPKLTEKEKKEIREKNLLEQNMKKAKVFMNNNENADHYRSYVKKG